MPPDAAELQAALGATSREASGAAASAAPVSAPPLAEGTNATLVCAQVQRAWE